MQVSAGNSGSRLGRYVTLALAAAALAALVTATWYIRDRTADPVALGLWGVGVAVLLTYLYAAVGGQFATAGGRRPRRPVAAGRIVAIVPAYEQTRDALRACIWSILNQRNVIVDEVHVVDDGSMRRPVEPFVHPRVRWHRTENGGKCAAQSYVLDRLEVRDTDFVLTVDSDCVLDARAVEHQLRAFSRPGVTAAVGLVVGRNLRRNLLTRLTDLNLGAARAAIWAPGPSLPTTAFGDLAMYRAIVLFMHNHEYVVTEPRGDGRRLALFAALAGKVVAVPEAVAWSALPTHSAAVRRQRMSWSTAWWRMIPYALTSMDSYRHPRLLVGLLQLALGPLVIAAALFVIVWDAYRGALPSACVSWYAGLYLAVRYARTARYLAHRPGMRMPEKTWTWLLLTPVEAVYQLLFLAPSGYLALCRLREPGSESLDNADNLYPPDDGSVYYTDYLASGGRP